MVLLRPVSAMDLVFLASVGALSLSSLARRHEHSTLAWTSGVVGWTVFSAFWATTAVEYLGDSRYFLGSVSLVTAGLSGYGVRLSASRIQPHARLTIVFAVMGLLFVPYQFLDPVFMLVVQTVTIHTATLLSGLGFEPTIVDGSAGPATAIVFETHPWIVYNIVSACTGFGAIALFAGLLAVAGGSVRRRIVGALGLGTLIYALNLLRTVIVGGSIPSEIFAGTGVLVTPLFGVDQPALVSFYFAEYVLAQTLVVVVLLLVYLRVVRLFPGIQTYVDALLSTIRADSERLLSRVADA
ncbi:archaeosortase A [Halapricum hydrolyticum]|uniref:Archaeosortase A n=1 Tax=Halapricum hydrolyticum TaxID=2979991 RepID=A0AAE3LEJ6_9EURY|nr:archaeosortase A [Halapricum hydrolyticum]MCU4717163.1 archaeosortase A [Halapricum hydrolyticum]MCU4726090.1 archaeosortase A [Halapricum hydrolyticum]